MMITLRLLLLTLLLLPLLLPLLLLPEALHLLALKSLSYPKAVFLAKHDPGKEKREGGYVIITM